MTTSMSLSYQDISISRFLMIVPRARCLLFPVNVIFDNVPTAYLVVTLDLTGVPVTLQVGEGETKGAFDWEIWI